MFPGVISTSSFVRKYFTQSSRFSTMNSIASKLPYFTQGEVVKGFGRGSKDLGIPTANFPNEVVDVLPKELECGVYFGLASVDQGKVHPMVLSVGWNPYYKNTKKTMETHIMHQFDEDFYGSQLKIIMLGYIRPMRDFKSLDDLITEIKNDINKAHELLEQPENKLYKENTFFKDDVPEKSR